MESRFEEKNKHNLFDIEHLNTSKVIWLTILWLIAILSCIISMSDFFKNTLFQRKDLTIWIIMIAATFTMIRIYRRYFRTKKD